MGDVIRLDDNKHDSYRASMNIRLCKLDEIEANIIEGDNKLKAELANLRKFFEGDAA